MTRALLLLVVAARTADAGTLEPSFVAPAEEQAFATTESTCDPERVRLRRHVATMMGAEIWVLHDCNSVPAQSWLAIRADAQWSLAEGFLVADHGSNMTDTPTDVRFVAESLSLGTFVDRLPAIVYQVVTRDVTVLRCHRDDCVERVVDSQLRAGVLVCRASPQPITCKRLQYTCTKRDCGSVAFIRGRLLVPQVHLDVPW